MTRLRIPLFLLAITMVLLSAPASRGSAISPGGYILCSCQLCATSDVDCQISPDGYTIACADYYRLHCK